MEFHLVHRLLRQSLTELQRVYGEEPAKMAVAVDAAWHLAMQMLDHCRPAEWHRSQERINHSALLSKACDEFAPAEVESPP